jgi:hypothetical protein
MVGVVIEIGRSRVVKRPHVGNRFTHLQEIYVEDVNLRKHRIIGLEGQGE